MDGHAIYMHGHAKNDDFPIDFAIFTKALPTDRRTNRRTDGPTDRPTDTMTYKSRARDNKKRQREVKHRNRVATPRGEDKEASFIASFSENEWARFPIKWPP